MSKTTNEQLLEAGFTNDLRSSLTGAFYMLGTELEKDLLGKVLTTLDAVISDPVQRKAVKDIMKPQIGMVLGSLGKTLDNLSNRVGEIVGDTEIRPIDTTGILCGSDQMFMFRNNIQHSYRVVLDDNLDFKYNRIAK